MKHINEFNERYRFALWKEEAAAMTAPRKGRVIRSGIFYSLMLIMVLLAFFYSGSKDPGKQFGSFSYNTVLTESMRDVYPKGSLITSWGMKPGEAVSVGLEKGTDIVYIREDGTVIVHRIIQVIDDYQESGQRVFRTQGVNNPAPDTWVTYEGNVVGRVTWHVPYVGAALMFVSQHILIVVAVIAVLFLLISLWKMVLTKENPTSS